VKGRARGSPAKQKPQLLSKSADPNPATAPLLRRFRDTGDFCKPVEWGDFEAIFGSDFWTPIERGDFWTPIAISGHPSNEAISAISGYPSNGAISKKFLNTQQIACRIRCVFWTPIKW